MIALVLAALAVQSASGDGDNLKPATSAAIVAGGKACMGSTFDPAGQDARLAGWTDATDGEKAGMKTQGRVVARDNVMLIVKTGVNGGCVVQAKTDASFDQARFYADLGTAVGAPIVTDSQKPVTNLAHDELLVTQVGGGFVQLVIASWNGERAMKYKGK